MSEQEAQEWLKGNRSTLNNMQSDPNSANSWIIATAQADAAMLEQAYWVLKAHKEGLLK